MAAGSAYQSTDAFAVFNEAWGADNFFAVKARRSIRVI
jgi:hypothetical protein